MQHGIWGIHIRDTCAPCRDWSSILFDDALPLLLAAPMASGEVEVRAGDLEDGISVMIIAYDTRQPTRPLSISTWLFFKIVRFHCAVVSVVSWVSVWAWREA